LAGFFVFLDEYILSTHGVGRTQTNGTRCSAAAT
jgi:hypothetical protein